jgi:hypothetical protein
MQRFPTDPMCRWLGRSIRAVGIAWSRRSQGARERHGAAWMGSPSRRQESRTSPHSVLLRTCHMEFFFSVPLAEGSKEGNYGSLGNGSRLYLPCKHQPIACQASQINDTFLLRSPNHRHPPLLSSCPNCPSPSATQHNAGAVALRRAVSASLPRWRVVGGRRRIPRRAPCACASVQQD